MEIRQAPRETPQDVRLLNVVAALPDSACNATQCQLRRRESQIGFGEKVREWNSKQQLEEWREAWERTANRYLEKHGFDVRIDRRTLEEQGIEREPTTHRGPNVDAMEKDGIVTERGEEWREAEQCKSELDELVADLAALENEIRAAEIDAYLDAEDRDRATWDDKLYDAAVEKEEAAPQFAEHGRTSDEASRTPSNVSNLETVVFGAEMVIERVFDIAERGVEMTLEAVATSFESLFEVGPARPMKPNRYRARSPNRNPIFGAISPTKDIAAKSRNRISNIASGASGMTPTGTKSGSEKGPGRLERPEPLLCSLGKQSALAVVREESLQEIVKLRAMPVSGRSAGFDDDDPDESFRVFALDRFALCVKFHDFESKNREQRYRHHTANGHCDLDGHRCLRRSKKFPDDRQRSAADHRDLGELTRRKGDAAKARPETPRKC